jgi:hypothetical protein
MTRWGGRGNAEEEKGNDDGRERRSGNNVSKRIRESVIEMGTEGVRKLVSGHR